MPPIAFTIRPVTSDDIPAILNVYRQCEDFLALGPQPTASLEMVLADLALSQRQGGVFCGVYAPDGEMMAIVDYVPSGWEGRADTASLSLLMIAAPYRGQGLGRQVVAWVEREIRRDPAVTAIDSGVQVNNPVAIAFWQRMGYRITSGPELMPDTTTVYHLWKDF